MVMKFLGSVLPVKVTVMGEPMSAVAGPLRAGAPHASEVQIRNNQPILDSVERTGMRGPSG